jgi:hypothetical protein
MKTSNRHFSNVIQVLPRPRVTLGPLAIPLTGLRVVEVVGPLVDVVVVLVALGLVFE